MSKEKQFKIQLPTGEYIAMFESKVVKSGNGGVIKAFKRYIGQDVVVLVRSDFDLVGKDGSYNKMKFD